MMIALDAINVSSYYFFMTKLFRCKGVNVYLRRTNETVPAKRSIALEG